MRALRACLSLVVLSTSGHQLLRTNCLLSLHFADSAIIEPHLQYACVACVKHVKTSFYTHVRCLASRYVTTHVVTCDVYIPSARLLFMWGSNSIYLGRGMYLLLLYISARWQNIMLSPGASSSCVKVDIL